MSSLQPTTDCTFSPRVAAKLPTAADVVGAYLSGGNWHTLLEVVGARRDVPAVEVLEELLDCSRENRWVGLNEKVSDGLQQCPPRSLGYHTAQLVISPTVDGILQAFNASDNGWGGRKPMWERTLDRLAASGSSNAFDVLAELLKSDNQTLSATARGCLRKMQAASDAPLHTEINRVLGTTVPRREGGLSTVADGDCLLHAVLGQPTLEGYRCEDSVIHRHRSRVANALKQCEVERLSNHFLGGLDGFYRELQEVAFLDAGQPIPNKESLLGAVQKLKGHLVLEVPFNELSRDSKQAVLDVYAALHAQPRFFFSPTLIPLLALSVGRPIAWYADGEGWCHVDSNGEASASPLPGAVAIRFNAEAQHFERVEPPFLEVEEELPSIDGGEISQLPKALQYKSSKFIASSDIGLALSPNKELDELPTSPTSTRPHSLPSSKPESKLAIVPLQPPKPTEAAAPRSPVKESWFARFFSGFSRFFF